MSPEQQRIAIATACGWKCANHADVMKFKQGWTMPEKWCMDPKGVLRFNHDRPDYLGDLNACHEMEKALTYEQMIDYSRHVGKAVTRHLPSSRAAWMDFKLITATAAQRAEAFLRTLNLWTSTPTQPQ